MEPCRQGFSKECNVRLSEPSKHDESDHSEYTYLHYTRHRNAVVFRFGLVFVVPSSLLVRPDSQASLPLRTSFAVLSYSAYALVARSDHASLQALMNVFTFHLVLTLDARSCSKRAVALYEFIRMYPSVMLQIIDILGEVC